MSERMSAKEAQVLLLADTLHRVPDRLARVQALLKPLAQGKRSTMAPDERLVVAQAYTALQFAIADVTSVMTFVDGALRVCGDAQKTIAELAREEHAAVVKKGSDLH
jgi:hypothetical protein